MEEIKKIINEKKADVSRLQELKQDLTNKMANPKLINDVNNRIRDRKRELEMVENIVEMSEPGENMKYKKGLSELKTHYEEEKREIEKSNAVAEGDKTSIISQLNDNIKTVSTMDKQYMKDTYGTGLETSSFLDDID